MSGRKPQSKNFLIRDFCRRVRGGMPLEAAARELVAATPQAAGYTLVDARCFLSKNLATSKP